MMNDYTKENIPTLKSILTLDKYKLNITDVIKEITDILALKFL